MTPLLLFLLNLTALGLSVELTKIHIQVHLHPGIKSFCSLAHAVSCLNVAESRFSVFAGMPMAVWSILGQLALAALIWPFLRKNRRYGLGLLTAGTWLALVVSMVMAGISGFILHSLCILCAGLGLVNLGMAVISLWQLRQRKSSVLTRFTEAILGDIRTLGKHKGIMASMGILAMAAIAGILWYPKYWRIPPRGGPGSLAHGFTKEGHPWIGAKHPRIVIEEFTDFQCPFCRRAHDKVRGLLERHADQVRLIHRDYPLDHHCNPEVDEPYHLRACELARAARCAGLQHRYWHMADMLFDRQPRSGGPDVSVLAHRLGLDMTSFSQCMSSRKIRGAIRADIEEGNRRHVDGTPTYFVNGMAIQGWPDEATLRRAHSLGKHLRPPNR